MESRMEALPDRNRGVAFDRFPPASEPPNPCIEFVSAVEMIAPLHKNKQQRTDASQAEISSEIVSCPSIDSTGRGNLPADMRHPSDRERST
jgi:hypothetical protein